MKKITMILLTGLIALTALATANTCNDMAEIAYLSKLNRDKGISESRMLAAIAPGNPNQTEALRQIVKAAFKINASTSPSEYRSFTYNLCIDSGVQ